MTLHGERQFGGIDAVTVIEYAYESCAARLDVDVDRPGTRIECIFDQFFDERRRTLHDLAGGDLVDERTRQLTDGHDGA